MSYFGPQSSSADQGLDSRDFTLHVRQNPQHALVTPEHKEKLRKPVDPPPIVQLKVDENSQTAKSDWLVNPFLFMTAILVEPYVNNDGSYTAVPGVPIIGQNVSSLHRLKDVDNKDGGFFVFGDLSVRRVGTYRIQFNLFDFDKCVRDKRHGEVIHKQQVVSDEFNVLPSKEFRGLMESTHLSRTFSDQGVRLRLRKEPRTLSGHKRIYGGSPPQSDTPSSIPYSTYAGSVHDGQHGYNTPTVKRQRSDSDYGVPTYNPSPLSAGQMSQYGSGALSSDNTWIGRPHLHDDQSANYSGPAGRQLHNVVPVWQQQQQQRLPQGPVSAPLSGNTGQYFGHPDSGAPVQRQQPIHTYSQLQNQQFQMRGSDDAYRTPTSTHAPTSLADSGLIEPQQQHVLQTAPEGYNRLGNANFTPSSTQAYDHPDLASSQRQPDLRPINLHQPALDYPTPSNTNISPASYDNRQPLDHIRYDSGQFVDPSSQLGMFQEGAREAYASSSGPLPGGTLPLDSGVLNRSFAPTYPAQQQQESYPSADTQQLASQRMQYPPQHLPGQGPMG